jgi:hypothetical protein
VKYVSRAEQCLADMAVMVFEIAGVAADREAAGDLTAGTKAALLEAVSALLKARRLIAAGLEQPPADGDVAVESAIDGELN